MLVNNAAFQIHTSRFEDLTEEHLDYTVKTNLYGYFYMAQACVEHMQAGAAILNIGSVTALLGNKDLIDYSMTKGRAAVFWRKSAGGNRKDGDEREYDQQVSYFARKLTGSRE